MVCAGVSQSGPLYSALDVSLVISTSSDVHFIYLFSFPMHSKFGKLVGKQDFGCGEDKLMSADS